MTNNIKNVEDQLIKEKEKKQKYWFNKFQSFVQEMEVDGAFLDVAVIVSQTGNYPQINIIVR